MKKGKDSSFSISIYIVSGIALVSLLVLGYFLIFELEVFEGDSEETYTSDDVYQEYSTQMKDLMTNESLEFSFNEVCNLPFEFHNCISAIAQDNSSFEWGKCNLNYTGEIYDREEYGILDTQDICLSVMAYKNKNAELCYDIQDSSTKNLCVSVAEGRCPTSAEMDDLRSSYLSGLYNQTSYFESLVNYEVNFAQCLE